MNASVSDTYRGLRVLAIHAHPDDESLYTAGALAYYARRGADVSVLTCTLGEEGEVIGDTYAQLVAAVGGADQLGGYRIHELMEALRAVGARPPQFLGGAGCFRDSGMLNTPANEHPRAFIRADEDDVAERMACWIRRLRPHIVLIYDSEGTYGHPDHRRAHRCGARAVDVAADHGDPSTAIIESSGVLRNPLLSADCATSEIHPAWDTPRLFWMMQSVSNVQSGLDDIHALIPDHWTVPEATEIFHTPDGAADVCLPLADEEMAAKLAALQSHATQVTVSGTAHHAAFAMSNNIVQPLLATEEYRLVRRSDTGAAPSEHDMAAGLNLANIEG